MFHLTKFILKLQIQDIYLIIPEIVALVWESEKEFIPQDKSTNIFLAAFTRAWARIKLYTEMEPLGENILYHDTDSIIYANEGTNDPPLGNFLEEPYPRGVPSLST